jgi:hypothetical protein
MLESLEASGPIAPALVATIGTYLLTAIGTSLCSSLNRRPSSDGRDDSTTRLDNPGQPYVASTVQHATLADFSATPVT